ncbi:MAG: tetratricopeptide repeat protein [Bacteroidota bacterium]
MNKKVIFSLFLVILTTALSYSQVKDSLMQIIAEDKDDIRTADALIQLTQLTRNPDSAIFFSQKALAIAKKRNYDHGIRRSLYNIGVAHHILGKLDSALSYYNEALDYADDMIKSKVLNNSGLIYLIRSDYVNSLHAFQQSLELKIKLNDTISVGNTYLNIGVIKYNQKEFDEAIVFYEKALLFHKKNKDIGNVASALGNIGLSYIKKKSYVDAINFYKKAFDIIIENPDAGTNSYYAAGLAEAYYETGKLDSAKYYGEMAYELSQEISDPTPKAISLHTLGLIALSEGNYSLSEDRLSLSQKIADESQQKEQEKDAIEGLYLLYKTTGNYQKALSFHEKFQQISDTLFNEDLTRQLTESELSFAFDQEKDSISFAFEKEKFALNADIEQKKLTQLFMVIGLIFLAVLVFVLYRFYSLKSQSNNQLKEKNEIINDALNKNQLLMREIHHRVKNNLQIVSSLLSIQSVYLKDGHAKKAVDNIQSRVLSMAMVHQNLYKGNDATVVDTELYLENLISSLEDSFSDENQPIDFEIDIASFEISSEYAVNLGLLVNEITTNSLKHAFPSDFDKKPAISISLEKHDNDVKLSVADNGIGMKNNSDEESYGSHLIKTLTKSMNGSVTYTNGQGTSVAINFRLDGEK